MQNQDRIRQLLCSRYLAFSFAADISIMLQITSLFGLFYDNAKCIKLVSNDINL